MRALALSGGLAALVLGTAVGPATAKPLEREHFHDSFSEVEEEFCGDLTVRHDVEVDGAFLVNSHGPDGLAYFLDTLHGTESFTNVANDKTFTNVFTQVSKDLKVTDNGDGTLTIVVMGAGMNKYFGPDGFLFHDSGNFRFESGRPWRHAERPVRRRGDRGDLPRGQGPDRTHRHRRPRLLRRHPRVHRLTTAVKPGGPHPSRIRVSVLG